MHGQLTQTFLGRLFPPCFRLIYKLQLLREERGKKSVCVCVYERERERERELEH